MSRLKLYKGFSPIHPENKTCQELSGTIPQTTLTRSGTEVPSDRIKLLLPKET